MLDGRQNGKVKVAVPTQCMVDKFDARKLFQKRLQQGVVALVLRVLYPRPFRRERKGLSDAVFAEVRYQNLKDAAILLIVDEGYARKIQAHRSNKLLDA